MRTALFVFIAALLLTAGSGDRIAYDQGGGVPMNYTYRTEAPDLSEIPYPRIMTQPAEPWPYDVVSRFDSTDTGFTDRWRTYADSSQAIQVQAFGSLFTEGGMELTAWLDDHAPDLMIMSKYSFDHASKFYPYGIDPEVLVTQTSGLATWQVFSSGRHWPAIAADGDTAFVWEVGDRRLINMYKWKRPFELFDRSPSVAHMDSMRASLNLHNVRLDWMLVDHHPRRQNVYDRDLNSFSGATVDYDEDGNADYESWTWDPYVPPFDIRNAYWEWNIWHANQYARDFGSRFIITHNGNFNGSLSSIGDEYANRVIENVNGHHFERNGANRTYSPSFTNQSVAPLASIIASDSLVAMFGFEGNIIEDGRGYEILFEKDSSGDWTDGTGPTQSEYELLWEQTRVATLYSLLAQAWVSLENWNGTIAYEAYRHAIRAANQYDAGMPVGRLLVEGTAFVDTVTVSREYTKGYVTATFDTEGWPTGNQVDGYDIEWTDTDPGVMPGDGSDPEPVEDPVEPLLVDPGNYAAGSWTPTDIQGQDNSVEDIHAPPYITGINATLEDTTVTGNWQEGSWDYNHFGKRTDWYNTPGKSPLNYWASRPAYRHAWRIGAGYLYNRMHGDDFAHAQARIDSMVRHLGDEQIKPGMVGTGGYLSQHVGAWVQWQWRPGRESPNLKDLDRLVAGSSTNNPVNSYSTGRAVRAIALPASYAEITGNGAASTFYSDPLSDGVDWHLAQDYDMTNYFNEGGNLVANAVWGMCSAYNYDPSPTLLAKIDTVVRSLESFQVKSGVQKGVTYQDGRIEDQVGTQLADHDTAVYYTAMITMAYVQAYYTLNEAGSAFAETALAAAKRALNHIVETRSNGDGTYMVWQVDVDGDPILPENNSTVTLPLLPYIAGFLAAYAEDNEDFNDTERTNLSRLLDESVQVISGASGRFEFYPTQVYRFYRYYLDGDLTPSDDRLLFLDP